MAEHFINAELTEIYTFPMSFPQARLWVMNQLVSEKGTYNIPLWLRIEGALDKEALAYATQKMVERHEILRTSFGQEAAQGLQVLHPQLVPDLQWLDASVLTEEQLRAQALEEAYQDFELEKLPLFRLRVYQVNERQSFLLLVFHHIIADGWSLGVFFREMTAYYAAYLGDTEAVLPELPIQYADYSVWQNEQVSTGRWEGQRQYWHQKLEGVKTGTVLLGDRKRPAEASYKGASHGAKLPLELKQALKTFANTQTVSVFMVGLTAFKILLHRFTASTDIVIGTPIANRNRKELEGLIGFFVNTLVLRTSMSPQRSFKENLALVRASTLEALAHQDYPFERLVAELQAERQPAYAPFFQIMFSMPPQLPMAASHGLEMIPQPLELRTTKFDLTLHLSEEQDGLTAFFEYNQALFDAETIEVLGRTFESLLWTLVTSPDLPIDSQVALPQEDIDRQFLDWNATTAPFPEDKCLHTLFEEQAVLGGDRLAVFEGEATITWAALNAYANFRAHQLMELGVKPGDTVAVLLEPGIDMVAGLLAVLKVRAAYLPIDPSLPSARVQFMLEDGAATALIYGLGHAEQDFLKACPALVCTGQLPDLEGGYYPNPDLGAHPEDLAYLIYTSGSTGLPKGCELAHRGVVNRIDWMWKHYGFQPSDRILQKTAFSFDVSVWEIFLPLCFGAQMVVASAAQRKDPAAVLQLIQHFKVTTLHFVPSMLKAFLGYVGLEDAGAWHSLTKVFTSGEALSLETVQRFQEKFQAKLHNLYGPTEASVDVSHYTLPFAADRVLIGRPIANTQLHILDENLRLLPLGGVGEICIGGVGLARGYRNRPELTGARFVANPFSPQEKLYRTGDLARWTSQGEIDFLGRKDTQVKIRGFRIEPDEVRAVLESSADVEAAYVRVDRVGEESQLTAIVVPAMVRHTELIASLAQLWETGFSSPDYDAFLDLLRVHCGSSLPEYMLPQYWILLDAIPVNRSGKADHGRLADLMPLQGIGVALEAQQPLTAYENQLKAIWERILEVEVPTAKTSFFALGGHSLKAIELISSIRQTLGIRLPLQAIFEAPTLALMAQLLARTTAFPALAIPSAPHASHYPLSSAQSRLWVLTQYVGGDRAYNIPVAFHLRGQLDPSLLKTAVAELWRRHDILRTSILVHEGSPCMKVAPFVPATVPIVWKDLSSENPSSEFLQALVDEKAVEDLRASGDSLAKVWVWSLSPAHHVLLLNFHHLIADGWSLKVAFEDICKGLLASKGLGAQAPALPFQYQDYAFWQTQQATWTKTEQLQSYWRTRFEGTLERLELQIDFPRPKFQSFQGQTLYRPVKAQEVEVLKDIAQTNGASLFMVLLALTNTLLYRYTGQNEFTIGSPLAMRDAPGFENQIGLYLNTLALRNEVLGHWTFEQLLQRIKANTLADYAHSEYPFDQLVQDLKPDRDPSRHPLFDTFLLLNEEDGKAHQSALQQLGIDVEAFPIQYAHSKFDLTFSLQRKGSDWELGLEFDTQLFRTGRAQALLRHFHNLILALQKGSSQPLHALSMLDAEDEAQLKVWENASYSTEAHPFWLKAFEQHAYAQPEAIALLDNSSSITYAELNTWSNNIAAWLRQDCQLKAGDPVALRLQRDAYMPLCILSILRAGLTYVPIDIGYPIERQAFMLQDSNPALVISSSIPPLELQNATSAKWVELTQVRIQATKPAKSIHQPVLEPDRPAYILYTSGSTGLPKGVVLSQGNLDNFLQWCRNEFGQSNFETVYAVTSYCFDLSVFEQIFPLSIGKRIRMLNSALEIQAHDHDPSPVLLNTVPSVARELLSHRGLPSSIRVLNLAGEAIDAGLGDTLSALQGIEVRNLYGPSEATTYATNYRFRASRRPVPIGKPIAGAKISLLDPEGGRVPPGIKGELYITGPCVALGYLNRPDLSEARFTVNPDTGERTYRTGDLAYWAEDGNLIFMGRMDHQVKVRGYRIEVGEVEAQLALHPEVQEAIVLTHSDQLGNLEMLGFVRTVSNLSGRELQAWLSARVPHYLVPSRLMAMSHFPLNPNGKVDRKRLLEQRQEHTSEPLQPMAPLTPTEEKLVGIWKSLLGLDHVDPHANFFDLGGNSILAVRLIALLETETGVRIEPQLILLENLCELARIVDEQQVQDTKKGWLPWGGKNKKGRPKP